MKAILTVCSFFCMGILIIGCSKGSPTINKNATAPISATTNQPVATTIGAISSTTSTANSTSTVTNIHGITYQDSIYNGDYPKYVDGSTIETYSVLIGGSRDNIIYFNQHIWNHWPSIRGGFGLNSNKNSIGALFFADNGQGDSNGEVFKFSIPSKTGTYGTKELLILSSSDLFFETRNGDWTSNKYVLDPNAVNTVEIKSINTQTGRISCIFSLYLKINSPKVMTGGMIYPNTIHMHGSFNL